MADHQNKQQRLFPYYYNIYYKVWLKLHAAESDGRSGVWNCGSPCTLSHVKENNKFLLKFNNFLKSYRLGGDKIDEKHSLKSGLNAGILEKTRTLIDKL